MSKTLFEDYSVGDEFVSPARTITEADVVLFAGLSWGFSAPIRFGDTIRGSFRVVELRPTSKPDRGIMRLAVEVRNQRDEVVQSGEFTMMLKRR